MKTITTNLKPEEAVERLTKAVEDSGLRLVAHINGQANAAKLGLVVPADQILEIFRPDYALRVWSACKPAGHDIPLRIHVYEEGAQTKVACRMPSSVFEPFCSNELDAISKELDPLFEDILSSVEDVHTA
jgi:uncharacterized protein (DUF302 family)